MHATDSSAAPATRDAPLGPIRVLVVEPAAGRRRVIRTALVSDERQFVVGMASDLVEARAHLQRVRADVLVADGALSDLDKLLQLARSFGDLPVVTVQRDWRPGGAPVGEGGVDAGAGLISGKLGHATAATLAETLRGIAEAIPQQVEARAPPVQQSQFPAFRWNGRFILIGASTGGVEAIEKVLTRFPADCPPTLIVQHMPAAFLASFAQRLGQAVAPAVRLAQDGEVLAQGVVLIAPGGPCHAVIAGGAPPRCGLIEGQRQNGHRPSVDVAFDSACPVAGQVVAALLTGMGRDGAAAMRRLRQAGARTLAQDSDSAVVWGMPGAAWREGGAEALVPLAQMGERMLALCSRGAPATVGVAPYG